ncbi:MAG: pyroglutamyl-peptidase I [Clostridia bacterium]|nr:pyroglutamyl-peptidase I [Clostridia bacterium]
MKQLLITGFDPFGGEGINPSWEAVRLLEDTIGEYRLTKLQLPTVFGRAADLLLEAADRLQPDAVLCVGQAGGRAGITPEVIGINLREARISDNEGRQPQNEPVIPGGPAAYFATLPVREMVRAVQAGGLSASLSYSAGAFVCNDVLYSLLHRFDGTAVRAGFVHVPYLPGQAGGDKPSMSLADIVWGLTLAIGAL